MITNCIVCKAKLIPVIYGRVDKDVLELQEQGQILISLNKTRDINSFCPLCEESYKDYTNMPEKL